MNTEIKKMWVDALRSGNYAQGKGCLHNAEDGTFCCLGVLCCIAESHDVTTIGSAEHSVGDANIMYAYGGSKYALPYEVSKWAGLTTDDPILLIGGKRFIVSELNDSEDLSFHQIADLVEAQL